MEICGGIGYAVDFAWAGVKIEKERWRECVYAEMDRKMAL